MTVAKELIPETALDRHVALLGMTGAGKTSVAKVAVVEADLAAGRRVIIIDPTGAWWGLRLNRDGKRKGFPIYIFGGDHGDYPLKAVNATMLAEAFATSSDSAIFDTSQMTVSERTTFFTEFAEAFRRRNKGWVRFVIDEAHLFMPQQGAKSGGGVPAMLHAGNNLVSLGRSRGLRIVMISQRASKLHKDSLTQASALIAMRLMHPLDRGAVEDWVRDQADAGQGREVIASLSHLRDGEAWVWAPMAKMLDRIQFPRPTTFDSSAAPDDGAAEGPQLAPINLDALKGKLAKIEAEKKATDPKALQAEVARLRMDLERKPAVSAPDGAALAAAEARGRTAAEAEMAPVWIRRGFEAAQSAFKSAIDRIDVAALVASDVKEWKRIGAIPQAPAQLPRPAPTVSPRLPSPANRSTSINGGGAPSSSAALPRAERKVLTALAQYPDCRTKAQTAVLTGYAVNGGGFNNAISALRTKGFISGSGDRLAATDDGLRALGPFDPLPTGSALLQHWLGQLGKAERAALEVLANAYPARLTKADLAASAGYEPNGGGFNNALSRLRTLELMTGRGDDLAASDNLFG